MHDAVDELSEMAHSKGLTIRVQAAECVLAADSKRLRQVLVNLLSNAIKFTDQGHVEVGLEVDQTVPVAVFSVSDTGCGIPADRQEVIFDRFRQVDSSMTRSAGGTGIGLSITKNLVELHGGAIRVASVVGEGSTFSFSLPLIKGAAADRGALGGTYA